MSFLFYITNKRTLYIAKYNCKVLKSTTAEQKCLMTSKI